MTDNGACYKAHAFRDACQTLDRLALPGAHLVRVNLVFRGNLLERPIAPKRLQRDLRLLLSLKI